MSRHFLSAVTFLNPWFLLASLACSAPLLAHLLVRHRKVQVLWAATQFLSSDKLLRDSSHRWKDWLLLLLRVAIPAMIVVAFARTSIDSSLSSNATQGVRLLIDDSVAMAAFNGQPFHNAKEVARGVIRRHRGSLFWVETTTGATSADAMDARSAVDYIEQMQLCDLPSIGWPQIKQLRPADSVEVAGHCVLISTFPRSIWGHGGDELASPGSDVEVQKLELRKIDVDTQASNVRARILPERLPHVILGAPFQIRGEVHNRGAGRQTVRVQFLLDQQPLQNRIVELEEGERREVSFGGVIDSQSDSRYRVAELRLRRLSGEPWEDSLDIDNLDQCILHVAKRPLVVIVEASKRKEATGIEREENAESESFHFAVAFDPFEEPNRSNENARFDVLLKTSLREAFAMTRSNFDLRITHLVIIGDHDAGDIAAVGDFVSGGGIAWFAPNQYGAIRSLSQENGSGRLLPLLYDEIDESPVGLRLSLGGMDLPPDASTARILRDGLADVNVIRRWTFKPPQLPDENEELLRDSFGREVLVGKRYGSGYVIQSAFGLSSYWSNLALQTSALPLIQVVANGAKRRTEDRLNFIVGEKPDLWPENAAAEIRRATRRPQRNRGVYSWTGSDATPRKIAVRLEESAGELQFMSLAQLEKAGRRYSGFDAISFDELGVPGRFSGTPLWNYAFYAAAVFILLEGWLANRKTI